MRCRKAFVVFAVFAVLGVFPLLASTPHRIDPEHFQMITGGMSRAEVEAIFGVPAGRYDWAEEHPDALWIDIGIVGGSSAIVEPRHGWGLIAISDINGPVPTTITTISWVSRHGAFNIAFDSSNRVAFTSSTGSRVVPPWQRWWDAIRKR